MYQRFISLAVVALMLSGATAFAQCGCSSSPESAPVATGASYYAPATVNYAPAAYVSNYAPVTVEYAPTAYIANYARRRFTNRPWPTPATTLRPWLTPLQPYVSYYAPAAPAVPYATYYAPAAPVVVPAYYGVPGWSVYGTPRVYVPGEPVRMQSRAVTP